MSKEKKKGKGLRKKRENKKENNKSFHTQSVCRNQNDSFAESKCGGGGVKGWEGGGKGELQKSLGWGCSISKGGGTRCSVPTADELGESGKPSDAAGCRTGQTTRRRSKKRGGEIQKGGEGGRWQE